MGRMPRREQTMSELKSCDIGEGCIELTVDGKVVGYIIRQSSRYNLQMRDGSHRDWGTKKELLAEAQRRVNNESGV
jgi:hypothetical protein